MIRFRCDKKFRSENFASAFGTSPAYDAFVAASNFPEMLFTLISGGALLTAFLPVFTEYLTRSDPTGAWKLASGALNAVLLLTALLALVSAIFAPQIARLTAPGFDAENLALTANRSITIAATGPGLDGPAARRNRRDCGSACARCGARSECALD